MKKADIIASLVKEGIDPISLEREIIEKLRGRIEESQIKNILKKYIEVKK